LETTENSYLEMGNLSRQPEILSSEKENPSLEKEILLFVLHFLANLISENHSLGNLSLEILSLVILSLVILSSVILSLEILSLEIPSSGMWEKTFCEETALDLVVKVIAVAFFSVKEIGPYDVEAKETDPDPYLCREVSDRKVIFPCEISIHWMEHGGTIVHSLLFL